MTKIQPLVSVYIPTKNRIQLLSRAVSSCLSQDYSALEILIVDDGSNAEQGAGIEILAKSDPRIRLFRHNHSLGAPAARNLALSHAKGDYFTGLDDDDEFMPNRISAFVSATQNYPEFDYFCSGYKYVLSSGKSVVGMNKKCKLTLDKLLKNNVIGNQIFARRDDFLAVGGFDTALVACQDYDMWLRLAVAGKTGLRLPETSYVVHQEHESERISIAQRRLDGHEQFINKHMVLLQQYGCLRHQLFLRALLGGRSSWYELIKQAPLSSFPLLVKHLLVRLVASV